MATRMLSLKQELPIILCTGYSDVVNESNIAQYGIQSYMSKPLNTSKLLRNVEELLVAS